MTDTTMDLVDLDVVRQKFDALRDALASEVFERETEIQAALVALVARKHLLALGEPGVAKTFLFDRLMLRIDGARFFSELLRKTIEPTAIFGPLSIPALKVEEFRYVTDGFLPDADVGLLDEVFKAGGTVLNGLLKIANERQFRNNGVLGTVPLSTLFMASNELPSSEAGEDLAAFWDRIDMRMVVSAPVDGDTWRKIARLRVEPAPPKIITWDEILAAQADARSLPVDDSMFDALDAIRGRLRQAGIVMSPRRYNQAQYLASAQAWLDGAQTVTGAHLEPLVHSLWEQPEQARDVERIVLEVISPGIKAALMLSDKIAGLVDELDAALDMPASEKVPACNELFERFREAKEELDEAKAGVAGRAGRVYADADALLVAKQKVLLKDGFGIDSSAISGLPA